MKQMINENISLSGEEGGMPPPGMGGPMFYENGVGSPDPHTHTAAAHAHQPMPPNIGGPDFAAAAEGILPATEEELLMEEAEMMRLREQEVMMETQNIALDPPADDVTPPSDTMPPFSEPDATAFVSSEADPNIMPSPVPNPALKSALFTSPPPKVEGEQTPLKDRMFKELDEENQHPNDANAAPTAAPTLQTAKSPNAKSPNAKSPGLKNAAQPVFASPTPSDKEAGLD